jgi:inorganic pyrophosphatase
MIQFMHANLPAFDPEEGDANVVIETPKGCRNKYRYDEQRNLFELAGVLPAGAVFPFDFGFIPSTKAPDGDPIDVLLLMDEPAYPGVLVRGRLIGVIEAFQTERDGKRERNDRLIAVAAKSTEHESIRTLKDLSKETLEQIEHFFVSYNQIRGKRFQPKARKGPRDAEKLVRRAINGTGIARKKRT